MRFPLFIARRYLFARKKQNAINVISMISVFGVAIGTAALVIVLSVFNGLDGLLTSIYDAFDPELKISLTEGKAFNPLENEALYKIQSLEEVEAVSQTLEDNALVRYDDKQYPAVIKGVDSVFSKVSGIDTMLVAGDYILEKGERDFAVVGRGVAMYLSLNINFMDPLMIYVPKRTGSMGLNPQAAFQKDFLFPSGVFGLHAEFDSRYILLPLDFARNLLQYEEEVSALEVKLVPGTKLDVAQDRIAEIMGPGFKVENREQQNAVFYKVMKSEKFYITLILSFILVIASFNIIGSLTMLIIEKKRDIFILRSMGTTMKKVRHIFFLEGWMITIVGAFLGLTLGLLICWLQIQFGLVKLQGSGSFIVDAYPVAVHAENILLITGIVLLIGFLAAWYPVRYISKRYLSATLYAE